MDNQGDVLIVGAGPTGLSLAMWLKSLGITPRIIDDSAGPGDASRAIAVQARTLELYDQIGLADEAISRGIKIQTVHLRDGRREAARIAIGDFGAGISPFPFVLSLPQDLHERLLVEKLKQLGVEVEWNTALVEFADHGDVVTGELRTVAGAARFTTKYLCGCDGANSLVRRGLGLQFPGGTYEQAFYVADVEASGDAAGKFCACLGKKGFCLVIPVRTLNSQRLIGIVPPGSKDLREVTFEDVRSSAEEQVGVIVHKVNWFSTYRLHHRVAESFRRGRVFIAGDAGHIHSPAGGQGMNTGIGDAINLAWKLAHVLKGIASPALLDTYEIERIKFARTLVKTTDQGFQGIIDNRLRGRLFRGFVMPHLIPLALRLNFFRRLFFRLVSQTRIEYLHSPLSLGCAGSVHGGERLPWVKELNNFSPLKSMRWQAHIYGAVAENTHDILRNQGLPLYEFPWTLAADRAGLMQNALYVIRPDGYVAFASPHQELIAYQAHSAEMIRRYS